MSSWYPAPELEVPQLHILPLDQLVEHEHAAARQTATLIESLQAGGTLRNPPIVAPLSENNLRFIVLDGSNRVAALRSLQCPHVLVQQVVYAAPQVRLATWRHVVTGIRLEQFTDDLTTVPGIVFSASSTNQAAEALTDTTSAIHHNLLARVICADGKVFLAHARGEALNLHTYNQLLNALVGTYQTRGRLFRETTADLDKVRRLYPELTALVIFPAFQAAEVLALARSGELLPSGLTRHIIEGRALHLNYPLSELRSLDPVETKEIRLRAWLSYKLAAKGIRFYGEATYLFDE